MGSDHNTMPSNSWWSSCFSSQSVGITGIRHTHSAHTFSNKSICMCVYICIHIYAHYLFFWDRFSLLGSTGFPGTPYVGEASSKQRSTCFCLWLNAGIEGVCYRTQHADITFQLFLHSGIWAGHFPLWLFKFPPSNAKNRLNALAFWVVYWVPSACHPFWEIPPGTFEANFHDIRDAQGSRKSSWLQA